MSGEDRGIISRRGKLVVDPDQDINVYLGASGQRQCEQYPKYSPGRIGGDSTRGEILQEGERLERELLPLTAGVDVREERPIDDVQREREIGW